MWLIGAPDKCHVYISVSNNSLLSSWTGHNITEGVGMELHVVLIVGNMNKVCTLLSYTKRKGEQASSLQSCP